MHSIYDHECTRCRLHEHAQTVCMEASGTDASGAMIVGEAPGREEDIAGAPFVGKAGSYLDRVLQEVGILRAVVFVTNAVKCRPPGNRFPSQRELNACNAYLAREIAAVDPRTILCLGNASLWALTRQTGITRARGTWLRLDRERETWVMPTYHPAFVLRQGLNSEAAEQFRSDVVTWISWR